MDCSLLGSPIHGIFWARVLEWVAISTTTALNSCLRIPSHSFIHSLENIEVRTIICLIQQSGFCRGPCLRDKQDNLFNVTLKGSENGTLNSQLVICQAWTWQNFPTEMLFVFWLSSPLDRTRSVSHSCFLFLSCIYISHFPGSPEMLQVGRQAQPDVPEAPVEQIILELMVPDLWCHSRCTLVQVFSPLKPFLSPLFWNVWHVSSFSYALDSRAAGEGGLGCAPSFTWVPSHILSFISLANSIPI